MNDEPIKAADLVTKAQSGLSRYRHAPDTLTELSGQLEDVQTTGEDDACRNGRITLVGTAGPGTGEIAKLRMTDVHTINGVRVKPERQ